MADGSVAVAWQRQANGLLKREAGQAKGKHLHTNIASIVYNR